MRQEGWRRQILGKGDEMLNWFWEWVGIPQREVSLDNVQDVATTSPTLKTAGKAQIGKKQIQ